MAVELSEIEEAMKDLIKDICEAINLKNHIDGDLCPGELIKSDALITIPGRLSSRLGIEIPLNCYPFRDSKNRKQLSIKDAAKKVYKRVKNGK